MVIPALSFVVIAYNEDHEIANCLQAIENQHGLSNHEIVVVDDGSTDHTAEVVKKFALTHSSVQLICQPNAGRGAARATGLAASSGELVAMVDGDLELPPEWLARCLSEIANGFDVVGGIAVPEGDASWLHSAFRLDPRPNPLTLEITGGDALYRRDAIVAIGFDAEMRTAEDIVFRHKLDDAGFTSKCLPDLVCIHKEDKGYYRTLLWMIESGVSATHQLMRFRPFRAPDAAIVLWLVLSLTVGFTLGVSAGLLMAAGWIGVIGVAHTARRFHLRASPWYLLRFTLAAIANSSIIFCYFVGRLAGLVTPNRIPRW